ncbi:F-box protein skip19 [Trifolium pratense]|uniref:F-box protein skip19 n=2 Tax=Trifolium pratense TaxID=57577 RepID=A0A2K3MA66_TRIPR|nr:F-box protein skip19 [Trifolium pratense]CAJ2640757.1 unnamed protein product [Trifolium pratense]
MASCKEKAKVAESMTEPNWLELPIDLTKNILQRLDTVDIVTSAHNVCPLWRNICNDPLMWRTIHMIGNISRFDRLESEKKLRCRASGTILFGNISRCDFRRLESLEKICRRAIDLSCGLVLEDIAIESFGTDDLLKYIAHRAGHIRRLQISCCIQISCKGIREFVKEYPLLEELTIEMKMKNTNFIVDCEDDEFPIAKPMPRLRHLKIFGIFLNDVKLEAILDCCPLLESLDLCMCICDSFSPSVSKRFHEKIKYFQPPYQINDGDDEHVELEIDDDSDD